MIYCYCSTAFNQLLNLDISDFTQRLLIPAFFRNESERASILMHQQIIFYS